MYKIPRKSQDNPEDIMCMCFYLQWFFSLPIVDFHFLRFFSHLFSGVVCGLPPRLRTVPNIEICLLC